ncbi:MAG: N-glycosylase/DNA lyase [Candidatus Omnitrophota bacterium]
MYKQLLEQYKKKKHEIQNRLQDFKKNWNKSDKEIFSELCFCICTPQSKAVYCDKAVSLLKKTGGLFDSGLKGIRKGLDKVRFPNNKARYIIEARDLFRMNGRIKIKQKINTCDILKTREWLVEKVKGLGYKEASHFLRNIGFGENLAILDAHILRCMVRYKIIKNIPPKISKKKYLFLEEKIKKFSNKINIPMDELDLLFWSSETGRVFK